MAIRALAVLGLAGLLAASASGAGRYAYKLYPGPARPAGEIAVVRMGDAQLAWFDGRPVSRKDWDEVHLLPGEHAIVWKRKHMPYPFEEAEYVTRAGLDSGHVYTLRAKDDPDRSPWELLFWIDDETIRQVIGDQWSH